MTVLAWTVALVEPVTIVITHTSVSVRLATLEKIVKVRRAVHDLRPTRKCNNNVFNASKIFSSQISCSQRDALFKQIIVAKLHKRLHT